MLAGNVCFVGWNNHLVPVVFKPLSFLHSCSFPIEMLFITSRHAQCLTRRDKNESMKEQLLPAADHSKIPGTPKMRSICHQFIPCSLAAGACGCQSYEFHSCAVSCVCSFTSQKSFVYLISHQVFHSITNSFFNSLIHFLLLSIHASIVLCSLAR